MTAIVIPIQVKRGLAAGLPTLLAGEWGFTTDTHEMYYGDGAANHRTVAAINIPGDEVAP